MQPGQRSFTGHLKQFVAFNGRAGQAPAESPQAGQKRDQLFARIAHLVRRRLCWFTDDLLEQQVNRTIIPLVSCIVGWIAAAWCETHVFFMGPCHLSPRISSH